MNQKLYKIHCLYNKSGFRCINLLILIFLNLAAVLNAEAQSSSGLPSNGNSNNPPAKINCAPPSCSIGGSSSICPGSATMICAPAGMASYLWSTGETTQCISVTAPGTYLVTIGSQGGCTNTCHTTLTAVNCSIVGNTTICQGGSTQLCALTGASSYLWSTGETTQCITVTSTGTYSVTVCINGCFVNCSVNVTGGSLNCHISGPSNVCNGGTSQLCAPTGMSSYLWSTGETTRCITVSSSGTYSVTINNGGCSSSCSKTVTISPPLNCNISGTTSICPGGSTQLCLPMGYASYSWNTGATTQCITVTAAGTYYGNVNDGTCNSTCHKTVTVNSPNCHISGNTTICQGGSTQLCAGSGFSSYSWSTGETTQCITVSSAGTYSVTVVGNGCTSTCSKTVSVGSVNCHISGHSNICNNGTAQLCAPSGMSSYLWSTGATTRCISAGTTGTYTVTVSNGGCTSSCTKSVTVYPPLNCAITGNSSICAGSSTQLCLPSGYASYSWNTGATTQCITVTSSGTYYGNVNDGTCNSTCHKTVNVTSPNCSISGNTNICMGGSTQLCAASGNSSYNWSNGASTQCITVTNAGTYSVTVTSGSGCTSSCSKTVTFGSLNCSISGHSTVCNNGTTQLCAPAGMSSYNWSTGETTSCITVGATGTYSVTISNGGCSSTCSKSVTVNPPLNCNISGNTTICSGGSTQLCLPSGYSTYSWNTGATTQCITVTASGTYFGNVSDGTCNSTCNKTVTVTNPNCSITGSSNICQGGSTQLCAASGFTSYSWSTGATSQCITVTSTGTYTVTVSGNGCSSSCSKTVTSGSINCNITGNTSICNGGSTQLCAPPGLSSYSWSTGATTQCISVSSAGNYTVTVSDNACTSSCSKYVSVNNTLNCSISGSNACCSGGTTQICAPPGLSSYVWSTGATTQCINVPPGTYSVTISDGSCVSTCSKTVNTGNPPNCNISGNPFICGGASTQLCASPGMASYLWSTGATTQCITVNSVANYQVIVTDAGGCSSSCNKSVYLNTPPICDITGNSSICAGGSTQLCATPGLVSYLWSTGQTTECIIVSSAANYSVVITDAHGCTSSCSKSITVNNPNCTITGNTNLCGGNAQLCGPAGAISYTWNTGASTQCITVTSSGTYSLTTIFPGGCSSTCTKTVTGGPACSISGCSTIMAGSATSLCAQPAGAGYHWSTGSTSQCISVNNTGTYSVTVTDQTGCSSICSQTQISQICYGSPTNTNVTATQTWTVNTTAQTATIRTTFAKTFVDNTYGSGAIGWPSGHSFGNLTGSDHVQLALYDANNVKKMEFKLDYFSSSNLGSSGYKSLGVTGGDGGMVSGSAADVLNAKTSMDVNFNDYGYVLTSNSPATTPTYTPNPTYPNWVFDVWYEVTVRLSAFPAGFGKPKISDIHASPSKTGHNTEIVVDTPCTPCVNPLNLGNLVWFDTNNNGLKDAIEPGLNNYTVKLYSDANNDNIPDGGSIATTITAAGGFYGFNGLIPGNYIVGVILHTGDSLVVINGGDPDNNIDNDNNGLTITNNEMRSKSVSLDFGTEPTNDGDGSDGNLAVDFAIHRSTPVNEKCYVGVSHHYVYAVQSWTINTTTNQATIRTTFSKNFVDNTYGANAIGWPNGHSFNNLTGSDKLQIALYDVNNVKKMEFKIDYVSSSNTFPSGYGTLGVTGGDGGMVIGNASDVISAKTSIDSNFNDLGYILPSISPSTNSNYTPDPNYPNWIYDVWYEVTVNLAVFPGGFKEPVITEIHASPSKTGTNTEVMDDTICIYPRLASWDQIGNNDELFVNAYPNPFKSSTTIEFGRPEKNSHIKIEIYSLSGSKIAELYNGNIDAGVTYKVEFNAEGLSEGIYFYRMEAEDRVINGKLILMD